MTEKKGHYSTRITFTSTKDMISSLDLIAKKIGDKGVKRSQVIRLALRDFIRKNK